MKAKTVMPTPQKPETLYSAEQIAVWRWQAESAKLNGRDIR